jgi:hypothetical protein
MNTITRIQIEFGEPATPLQIPVRHATATASRLPGVEWVDFRASPGSFRTVSSFNTRSFGMDQFITRMREMLCKRGTE